MWYPYDLLYLEDMENSLSIIFDLHASMKYDINIIELHIFQRMNLLEKCMVNFLTGQYLNSLLDIT